MDRTSIVTSEIDTTGPKSGRETAVIIRSVRVRKFRCIRDETLPCEQLTVLVGPNGSGKSSFLRAIEMFYTPSSKYTAEDFYDRDTSQDIIVTVAFTDLTEREKKLFPRYLEGEELTVEKVMTWPAGRGSQKYYGTSLQNREFDSFRSASGPGLRREYNKLRDGRYSDLPNYTNRDDAEKALQAWEQSHADECLRRRDDGQFFGFTPVGQVRLERFTRFIPVPAVRDASEDAAEGRGATLTQIMDLVVRSVLAERKEIAGLRESTQEQYEEIVDPTKLEELQALQQNLSSTLKTYVPDSGVRLAWLSGDIIDIPMPRAEIKLVEDEYEAPVERTGHGLQRAFILTMLQHLAVAQSPVQEGIEPEQGDIPETGSFVTTPNLILGIEEPELYQHPNRQRHLCRILMKLAMGTIRGVAEHTQIIYSTHSPLLVDIRWVEKVRVLRKVRAEADKPRETRVTCTNLDEVAKIIEKADGKPEGTYTAQTLEPRLRTLMTPWMNEGFFADVAVLVEGEEDRAAVLGVAAALGHDPESLGISVIPCMGKNNLDRPTAIFRKLGIPVYVVWDGDYGDENAKPQENHRLLRLFDEPIEDWPERVTQQFACFKRTLHHTMQTEIGERLFDSSLRTCCERLCLGRRKDAVKNPQVMQEVIEQAQREGASSKTLEKIIGNVLALKRDQGGAEPG